MLWSALQVASTVQISIGFIKGMKIGSLINWRIFSLFCFLFEKARKKYDRNYSSSNGWQFLSPLQQMQVKCDELFLFIADSNTTFTIANQLTSNKINRLRNYALVLWHRKRDKITKMCLLHLHQTYRWNQTKVGSRYNPKTKRIVRILMNRLEEIVVNACKYSIIQSLLSFFSSSSQITLQQRPISNWTSWKNEKMSSLALSCSLGISVWSNVFQSRWSFDRWIFTESPQQ